MKLTRDPFQILAELTHRAADVDTTAVDVESIVDNAIRTGTEWQRRRRKWRRFGIPAIVVATIGTGGGLAAAFIGRGHVSKPEGGTICRAAPELDSAAIVLGGISADPIADCARFWQNGQLPDDNDPGSLDHPVPELFVCVDQRGALDVYPRLGDESCSTLGLEEADVAAAAADPIVALQERLVDELGRHCVTIKEAQQAARAALHDYGLDDWSIVIQEGDGPCGRFGLDSETSSLYIVPGPP